MQFSAPAPALKAALDSIAAVIQPRSTIPVLGTVRVSALDATLLIAATNLEVYVEVEVPDVTVETSGEACIPAAELIRLVGLARKQHIEIVADDRSAAVRFGRSSAEIMTFPVADFPAAPDWSALAVHDVDGGVLSRALRFCAATMASDETLYFLRGVKLYGADGGAVAVSTDKIALSRAAMPGVTISGSATIPDKHVPIVASIASKGRVRLGLTDNAWVIIGDGIRARGSTVDGSFPDVDRIVSGNLNLVAVADRAALLEAMDIAVTGAARAGGVVHVVLDIKGDEIALRGQPGPTMAKGASAVIDAETRASVLAMFNANYLRDTLKSLDCDRVAILDAGLEHATILHVEPAEQATDIRLKGVVSALRASPAEMAA